MEREVPGLARADGVPRYFAEVRPEERARTYRQLSGVFRGRFDADLHRTLSTAVIFQGLVPADADQLAADHYELFGRVVFPNAGVFVDPEGMAGRQPGHLADLAALAGYSERDSDSRDSVASLLALLAHLAARETASSAAGRHSESSRLREAQATVLRSDVLPWFPVFVCAVERTGPSLFSRAAQVSLATLLDHARELGVMAAPPTHAAGGDPLQDDRAGLRDVAEWLTRTDSSGFFLSRADIEHVARMRGLPRGFGDRVTLLVNLLRSAVRYGSPEGVLLDIEGVRASFESFLDELANVAALETAAQAWKQRLRQSRGVIQRLAEAAHAEHGRA